MEVPLDAESIRRVLEQAAGTTFQQAQAGMEDLNFQDAQNVRRLLQHAATEAIARAQEFEIPRSASQCPADAFEGTFIGLWPILRKLLIIWSIGFFILLSSIGMYGLFYVVIQPGRAASEPLFFDYSGIAQHPAPQAVCSNETFAEESCWSASPRQELVGAPWAAVDFFAKHTQWEAYHYEVIPRPLAKNKILREGMGYFFEVALELPESRINHKTGMFMVHVDLQSSNGTRLASSIRAARLPHETQWIANVRKSIWLIPMMIGAVHETRSIVIPSFRHFRESAFLPLRYATVSLVVQAKDKRWKDDPVEVTKGEIRIGKELTDLQFVLRDWFFTCYIVGVIVLSTMQISALIVCKTLINYRWRQRILHQMQEVQEDLSEGLNLDESQLEMAAEVVNEWDDMPATAEVDIGNVVASEDTAPHIEDEPAPPTPVLGEEHNSAQVPSNSPSENSEA